MPTRPRPLLALPRRLARLALACACALAGLAPLGCGGEAPRVAPSAPALRGPLRRIVVATGTIEPIQEVEVRPRIAGILERIHVEEGDEVTRGQLLVEIERDLLASQAREAEAALREARVEGRYAAIDLERAEELVANGARSDKYLDDARARMERASAAEARAAAAFETISTQLGYARITSPLDGRVLDVHEEEGSAVSPVTAVTGGTLLLSLAATERLHLEGLVDENEVARIEIGQPAEIRTEAFGDRTFEGRVAEIAPLGTRIQNVTYFEVEIDIVDEDAHLLKPRMSGDADVVTAVLEDALSIPEVALRYLGDRVYVEVLNGQGPPVERDVTIGIVDGQRVEIREGLEEGEEVTLQ